MKVYCKSSNSNGVPNIGTKQGILSPHSLHLCRVELDVLTDEIRQVRKKEREKRREEGNKQESMIAGNEDSNYEEIDEWIVFTENYKESEKIIICMLKSMLIY